MRCSIPNAAWAPKNLDVPAELLDRIASYANGDARSAYNLLETLARSIPPEPPAAGSHAALLEQLLQKKLIRYDKAGEEHFNQISALHKSVRNSDADAALYWLARMIESGEDPMYWRGGWCAWPVRISAWPIHALRLTIAAMQAFQFIGPPEGHLALAEAAVYLALAPKSNALYTAYGEVQKDLGRHVRGAGAAASAQRGERANAPHRLWRRLPIRS